MGSITKICHSSSEKKSGEVQVNLDELGDLEHHWVFNDCLSICTLVYYVFNMFI